MYEDFIAERINQLRGRKKVSAREMSLAIGQNSSYINRIENKVALPSMPSFFYICDYLGVTPGEFFDEANPCPGQFAAMIADMKKLNEEELNVISAIVKMLAYRK